MRIAVIGGGQMGEALIAGLLRREPAPTLCVAEKVAERAAALADGYPITIGSPVEAVAAADAIVLVVKPQDVRAALGELAEAVPDGALILSIAAGIPTSVIEAAIPQGQVVRAMPNTPARIQAGVTGISAGASCSPQGLALAEELMSAVGSVIVVPEELQDAITATSGSGPAYVFYLAEAMLEAAGRLGLDPEAARRAVVGTLIGAAGLLQSTGADPAQLRAAVTSPHGTTAAAIAVLDEHGVRQAVIDALLAARDRSRDLASS